MAAISGSSNCRNNYYSFDQIEGVKERLEGLWSAQKFDEVIQLIQCAGQERFECVEFCIQKNADWVVKNSRQLEISTLDSRFDLALLCARKSPVLFAQFIQEFRIEDSKDRFVLARACGERAQTSGEKAFRSVVGHILNFNILDTKDRFALAKFFCQGASEQVAEDFEKFQIEDAKDRLAIATLCARSNTFILAQNIEKFNLPIEDFYPIMMESEGLFFDLNESEDVDWPLAEFFSSEHTEESIENMLSCLREELKEALEEDLGLSALGCLLDDLDELENNAQKWVSIKNTAAIFFACEKVLSGKQLKVAMQGKLFQTVLEIKNQSILPLILSSIVRLAYFDPDFKKFSKVMERVSSFDLKSFGGMLPVLSLLLAHLDLSDVQLNQLLSELLYKKEFKDGPKARSMLSFLLFLERTPTLLLKDKQDILARLVQVANKGPAQKKEGVMKSLQAFSIVLLMDEGPLLLESNKSLFSVLEDAVKRKFPRIREIPDFSAKWERTFGSCREPWAILTYISRHLDSLLVMDSMGEYIFEVLNGNFKKERYNIEYNNHLKLIHRIDSNLLDCWKQDVSVSLKDGGRAKELPQFDPLSWLRLNVAPRLKAGSYFSDYLNSQNEGDRLKLKEQLKAALKGEGRADRKNGFELEMAFVQLAEASPDQHEACLQKLLEFCAEFPRIADSIKSELDNLKNRTIPERRSMIGLNTDDPYLLLLCGTDIQGSCLRIDGDPEITRGLCGYLWNGQTRLLAIVDEETGRIMGRSMLRLLLDANQKPVLFLEKYYGEKRLEEEIKSLAIETAKRLKLDLTHVDLNGSPYPTKLLSKLGRAPYEYVDRFRDLIEYEEFEISDVAFLYQQGEDSSKGQGKEVL